MANEITSGRELNSYQGDAGLGTVAGTGYGKIDLTPLNTYAAYAYNTHLEDYKQQQKDKAKLEEMYNDPNIYLQLEKGYGDQLNPLAEELKSLGRQNLQMQPNTDSWYKFMDAHNKLVSGNAKLKAVQDIKDSYKKTLEASADPHEKERISAYIDKLSNYKLGEEVPAYDKYFKYNDDHIPTGVISTGTKQEISPSGNLVTKKFTVRNATGLDRQALQTLTTNPEAANTYSDIAHKYLEQGDLSIVNDANANAFDKNMRINMADLQTKNQEGFAKYLKQFPGKTFGDYMNYVGKSDELNAVQQGLDYLNPNKSQVSKVTPPPTENLTGYTYYVDPKTGQRTRLSVPDYVLGAMMGATKNVPGQTDEVVNEIPGLTPKDKFEAQQRLQIERENNAQRERDSKRDDATKRYIAGLKDYADGTSKTAPELPMTPLPSILSGIGYNKPVSISTLPISQVAAINPNWIDKSGQLKGDLGDIQVSVGTREDKSDGVFIVRRKVKGKGEESKATLNESQLKSNAESWLAAFAKERKGQEVYGYIQDLYDKAKGIEKTQPAATPPSTGDVQTKKGRDGKVYKSSDGVTWKADDGTTVVLKKK